MKLDEACDSLKLECALRELGFVNIDWKCIAHAGLYFVCPFGLPDDPDSDLIGFSIYKSQKVIKISSSAKKALDYAIYLSYSSYTRHSGSSGCISQNSSSAFGS